MKTNPVPSKIPLRKMLCPVCMEQSALFEETNFNWGIIRFYICSACGHPFTTSEQYQEQPYDFVDGEKVYGINQRFILNRLKVNHEIDYGQMLKEFKQWCLRVGKTYNRQSFHSALKRLCERNIIHRCSRGAGSLILADRFRSDRKIRFYDGHKEYIPTTPTVEEMLS